MHFLEIQILQRTQKSVSVKPFPKEAGQKSKTLPLVKVPSQFCQRIDMRDQCGSKIICWSQRNVLRISVQIQIQRSKFVELVYQKAGQNNAIPATCQIPKSTGHLIALSLSPMIPMWTRRVPWRGRVQLAKTTFDSKNCFLYEK